MATYSRMSGEAAEQRAIAMLAARANRRALASIGSEWGLTRERVRQIIAQSRFLVQEGRGSPELASAVAALDEAERRRVR